MKKTLTYLTIFSATTLLLSCGAPASSSQGSAIVSNESQIESSVIPTSEISSETSVTPSSESSSESSPSISSYTSKEPGEPGYSPVISDDGKTALYGFYPTKHISDESLISSIAEESHVLENGWRSLGDKMYAKETAKVYNSESYAFDDGTSISEGTIYWFEVEPIVWDITKKEGNVYSLSSSLLLDAHAYYRDYSPRVTATSVVYPNNYKESDIRAWLNASFYETAFGLCEDYFAGTAVDNSPSSTDSAKTQYASESTNDKVYLPSYADLASKDASSLKAKTSDYARSRGAWASKENKSKNNGSYWTRSPSSSFDYCAWNVNSGGYLSEYAVDGVSHSVRPCIDIRI